MVQPEAFLEGPHWRPSQSSRLKEKAHVGDRGLWAKWSQRASPRELRPPEVSCEAITQAGVVPTTLIAAVWLGRALSDPLLLLIARFGCNNESGWVASIYIRLRFAHL